MFARTCGFDSRLAHQKRSTGKASASFLGSAAFGGSTHLFYLLGRNESARHQDFCYAKMLGTPHSRRTFSPNSGLTLLAKKEALALPVLLFWVPPPFGRLHPIYLICSGRVNRPGIKIFANGKNLGTPHSRRIFSGGTKRTDGCARSHQAAQKSASLDAPVSVRNTPWKPSFTVPTGPSLFLCQKLHPQHAHGTLLCRPAQLVGQKADKLSVGRPLLQWVSRQGA